MQSQQYRSINTSQFLPKIPHMAYLGIMFVLFTAKSIWIHRLAVINWYIQGIPLFCHFKMMNCHPITEIFVISPEVHDFAICTIIPHPFFSSSLNSSNIIFWSLFKLLFPVLCYWLFSFFFKWLTQALNPSPPYALHSS